MLDALHIMDLPVTVALFAALAVLPNLTFLEATVMSNTQPLSAFPARSSVKATFHTLESLYLDYFSSDTRDSPAALSSFRFPRLKHMNLQSSAFLNGGQIADMFQQISLCALHTDLKVITVDFWVVSPLPVPGDEEVILNAAAFRCLFVFRDFHLLELEIELFIVLDDDALKDMAMSWPFLVYLQLRSIVQNDCLVVRTAVTLNGLAHFARYCPALQDLVIDVDISGPLAPFPETNSASDYQSCALRDITFLHLFMQGNHARIGAYPFAIFPNLESVLSRDIYNTFKPWQDNFRLATRIVPG
ncbi:hypothetical protein C8Q72DRAFT_122214 [Fomitopsis betulina]|nr:hypothetical protein C8Q72DRAFT_122214 [Fomitopsis betulina]